MIKITSRKGLMIGDAQTASIRSFTVNQAIKDNISISLYCEEYGKTRVLTPSELRSDVVKSSPVFKSKIEGGQDYRLYNYVL